MTRRIAVITTSRADYSHLYWPLRELAACAGIDLRLIALGPHLSPEFGLTVREIERDGFALHARLECLLSSDTDVGMAKTIGVAVLSLADCLGALRPDLLLLIADRYEMLAPAAVALALRIPLAHIEGGEITAGAIDDAVRNAITKMSHVHFASTERSRQRIIAMGEEAWRVHRSGAPSLDHLHRGSLPARAELERSLGMELRAPTLVAWHPLTLAADTLCETDALFNALRDVPGQIVFLHPNADAGSRAMLERIRAFIGARVDARLFINLEPRSYWALLREASLFIGNSSSGVMETPSFRLPCVNVGSRQDGRERAGSIIDVPADERAIAAAVRTASGAAFRESIRSIENPYGDGRAAGRIARVLNDIELGPALLRKAASHDGVPSAVPSPGSPR